MTPWHVISLAELEILHDLLQKFGICIFFFSERNLSYSQMLHLFNKKYSENSNIEKYYNNFKYVFHFNIFLTFKMYSYDGKAQFSAAITQCHMILQKSI